MLSSKISEHLDEPSQAKVKEIFQSIVVPVIANQDEAGSAPHLETAREEIVNMRAYPSKRTSL